MKRLLKLAKTLGVTYYAYMMEYRAELLLWALSGSLPFILMGAWNQAASQGNFGMTALEFTRYFLAIYLARQLSVVWVIWDFEREIVEGKLAFKLLQPMDPVWHHVFSHASERFARMPFIMGIIAVFFLLYPAAFWVPSAGNLVLFSIAAGFAFALQFLIQYTLAMFAFWTEKASSIQECWYLVHLFFSGAIAPLEVYPAPIKNLAMWLPFPYILDFPASLLVGLEVDVVRGFGMMTIWFGVFLVINRVLWRQGIKQFSGMGA
jgi:ABC-2 type transport system permease protein